MKKIFTLIAMAAMAIGVNAQEKALFENGATYGNGATISSENCKAELGNNRSTQNYDVKLTSIKAYCAELFGQTVQVANEDTGEMEEKTRVVYVVGQENPKDGELDGDKSTGSGYKPESANLPKSGTYYMVTPAKSGHLVAFIVLNSGKSLYVAKASTGECLPTSDLTIKADGDEPETVALDESFQVADKVTGTLEFDVEAGETYYIFCTGSKLSFGGYVFTAAGEQPGGGEQPSGDVDKYIAAPDGVLAAEFAAVVDGENATNVVDGKSVVTITTDNVTLEAVGGATPANIDGGAQDITPGTVVDAETHRYEVASVGSWNNVTWKNGQNKTDINDEAGTKLYFVIGSGNPYIKMYAEEIYTDDAPTGRYRAAYDYYKPGMDMPQVGLYYKFTTKTDGKMKVQVWANKGNRNTYLINGQTKEAVAYQATGYVNGQKVVDENNEKVLNAEGQEMMRLFTPEEIQERHNAAKVGEDGVDTAPYVIDQGNQAFWGWIIFDAKAGVDYWLFQDSSQIGFGGFEFTTGSTGIENVQFEKVQKNKFYNLQGQAVSKDYKGIVIKNGKKYLNK